MTAGRRVPSQDGTSQTARSWLVVGANGMLGHDLVDVISQAGHQVIGLDLPSIDITVSESVAAALDAVKPDVVVNAAAYTAVDDAEENEPLALLVNGEGPRILAAAIAARAGTRLVHLSTDYVFSGDATSPYAESGASALLGLRTHQTSGGGVSSGDSARQGLSRQDGLALWGTWAQLREDDAGT